MELLPFILIAICVLFEGFFSGSEIALVSLSRLELQKRLQRKEKGALLLEKLLKEPEKLLTTTLIGTNLSTVTGSAVFTTTVLDTITSCFPPLRDYPELVTVLCFTPITLTFGELIPKSLFQKYSHRIAFKVIYPIYFFYLLFKPVSVLVMGFARLLAKSLGTPSKESPFVTKEELKLLVESASRLKVERTERKILKNILRLREKTVGDIYVPLLNVVAVEEGAPIEEVLRLSEQSGFSKFPVYRNRFDNIVGYILLSDLLDVKDKKVKVKELMRPILIFPEYMSIFEALKEFRRTKEHIAIVVDEYGSTLGIVTPEDILEEIVGNIEDEFDKPGVKVIKKGKELIADGTAEVEEVNRFLRKPLPTAPDYTTVAGLILSQLGRFPKKGEKLKLNTAELTVLEVDPKKIKKVKIREL